jgi:hypothetical protein
MSTFGGTSTPLPLKTKNSQLAKQPTRVICIKNLNLENFQTLWVCLRFFQVDEGHAIN